MATASHERFLSCRKGEFEFRAIASIGVHRLAEAVHHHDMRQAQGQCEAVEVRIRNCNPPVTITKNAEFDPVPFPTMHGAIKKVLLVHHLSVEGDGQWHLACGGTNCLEKDLPALPCRKSYTGAGGLWCVGVSHDPGCYLPPEMRRREPGAPAGGPIIGMTDTGRDAAAPVSEAENAEPGHILAPDKVGTPAILAKA